MDATVVTSGVSTKGQAMPGRAATASTKRRRAAIKTVLAHAILIAIGAVMLTPFAWMVSTSLKGTGQEFVYPPQWIPDPPVWENYKRAMTLLPFHLFFRNTIVVCALALVGQLLTSSLVAFGFARLQFQGRDLLFILVLSTMMLPGQVTLIPTFLIFRTLGWIDTLRPLIVPAWFGGGAFFIFLLRQFFATIPYELDEAARVDGANSFWIWGKVIVPLSRPAIATIAVFSFLGNWNDFMGPLIYLHSTEKKTIAVGLRAFQDGFRSDWNLMMAAATVSIIPVLIVFFMAQNYFLQGIVMTGMGGR